MHLDFDNLFNPSASQIYVVGGTVRDILLDREPLDIDIAVYPNPDSYARQLANRRSGRLVKLGRPGQTLYRVVTPTKIYDITKLQGNSIREDLSRRDFTINAIAYDIIEKKIIDVTKGQQDLDKHIIRMVTEKSLQDDPIRLIRAYRLAAELQFKIEPVTKAAIAINAKQIKRSAGERIRDELFKILATPSSQIQLFDLAANDLLINVFPELLPLKKLYQYNRSSFDQSLEAFSRFEKNLQMQPVPIIDTIEALGLHRQPRSAALLKLTVLLHQIGKTARTPTSRESQIRYNGYARHGAALVDSIAARLHLSNRDAAYIGELIRNHRRPWYLFKAHQERNPVSTLHMVRFILNYAPHVPDLFLLALAEAQVRGNTENFSIVPFQEFAHQMLRYYQSLLPRIEDGPIINGDDLKNRFGLPPSPLFRLILKRVEELRLIGRITSEADAYNWVQAWLDSTRTAVD